MLPEPKFVRFKKPRNRFRQAGNRFLGSLTGLQSQALQFCAQAAKSTEAESKEKPWCMGPYAGVDYNLSPYVNSRVDSNTFTMGNGQTYARVDFNPMPELTLFPSQRLGFWPRDHKEGVGLPTHLITLIKLSPSSTVHITRCFLLFSLIPGQRSTSWSSSSGSSLLPQLSL